MANDVNKESKPSSLNIKESSMEPERLISSGLRRLMRVSDSRLRDSHRARKSNSAPKPPWKAGERGRSGVTSINSPSSSGVRSSSEWRMRSFEERRSELEDTLIVAVVCDGVVRSCGSGLSLGVKKRNEGAEIKR